MGSYRAVTGGKHSTGNTDNDAVTSTAPGTGNTRGHLGRVPDCLTTVLYTCNEYKITLSGNCN